MDALRRATEWVQDNPGTVLAVLITASVIWVAWDGVRDHSTFVLAIAAIGLTVWQARITRHHNRLSVRPKLSLWAMSYVQHGVIMGGLPNPGILRVEVRNAGLGSAIIAGYRVWFDGNEVDTTNDQALLLPLAQLFGHGGFALDQFFGLKGEHVMRAGDMDVLLAVTFDSNFPPDCTEVLRRLRERFTLEMTYRSMYDEPLVCTWPSERAAA